MILCDANVLIALTDPRNALHSVAVTDLENAANQSLLVIQPVLVEAVSLLPHPLQRHRLYEILQEHAMAPVGEPDNEQLRNDVFNWLNRYAEHAPDWTAGHLAVLCGRERTYRVWTYDREFRTTWRRPNGTRIPVVGRDLRR